MKNSTDRRMKSGTNHIQSATVKNAKIKLLISSRDENPISKDPKSSLQKF